MYGIRSKIFVICTDTENYYTNTWLFFHQGNKFKNEHTLAKYQFFVVSIITEN